MPKPTFSVSDVQREWTELDEIAAREGAAELRLSRRIGIDLPKLADERRALHARRAAAQHCHYDTAAAVEAFDRLFRGEAPAKRREAPGNVAARMRRYRERRRARHLDQQLAA